MVASVFLPGASSNSTKELVVKVVDGTEESEVVDLDNLAIWSDKLVFLWFELGGNRSTSSTLCVSLGCGLGHLLFGFLGDCHNARGMELLCVL